jgi:hypothetical protein
MSEHAAIVHQGHRYRYGTQDVIALQSGPVVQVIEIDPSNPCGMGRKHTVKASWLSPAPMRYFMNEVPT